MLGDVILVGVDHVPVVSGLGEEVTSAEALWFSTGPPEVGDRLIGV